MSKDDIAEIPPWRKNPSEKKAPARQAERKHQDAPPSLVGESASVASLDDRKEKREKERADFQKFLKEKRHAKVGSNVNDMLHGIK